MLANPAVQAWFMFLIGTALALSGYQSQSLAFLCWAAAALLMVVSFLQWLRWPGRYGRKLQSIWYLRWGGRISLRKAAEILYSEARAQDSIWAEAAERMGIDKSPDGILSYIAQKITGGSEVYGRRPPSTHVEKLDTLQLKYASIEDGARELRLRDKSKSVFTDLEVSTKDLRRNLREIRGSLKSTTPI